MSYYHVINIYQGNYSVQGTYKSRDSAERRSDRITGGETHVFESQTPEPSQAIYEFRQAELKKI